MGPTGSFHRRSGLLGARSDAQESRDDGRCKFGYLLLALRGPAQVDPSLASSALFFKLDVAFTPRANCGAQFLVPRVLLQDLVQIPTGYGAQSCSFLDVDTEHRAFLHKFAEAINHVPSTCALHNLNHSTYLLRTG